MRNYESDNDWNTPSARGRNREFRNDLFSRRSKENTISEKRKQRHTPRKDTLVSTPSDWCIDLMLRTGIPQDLLSQQAARALESDFRQIVTTEDLKYEDARGWLNREYNFTLSNATKKMNGKIFEELITREFPKRNPDYFVTNPFLTSRIINPVLDRLPPDMIMPDHLVFLKRPAIFTGFIEDKKTISQHMEQDVLSQLQTEWDLYQAIAADENLQFQLKRNIRRFIPSMYSDIEIAPIESASIWLASTAGESIQADPLPEWLKTFESSIPSRSIAEFTTGLINERFLPHIFPQLVPQSIDN